MKRHQALENLSREHQTMQLLIQVLKNDASDHKDELPTTLLDKQRYALKTFETLIAPHMKLEEEKLFPLLWGLDTDMDQLMYILTDDHADLEYEFNKLLGDTSMAIGAEWTLEELGKTLEKHINLEENEFFESIQKHANAELLTRIAQSLAH